MNVQINIQCPTCSHELDSKEHVGLTINRKSYLRSQLISMREQRDFLRNRKPKKGLESAVEFENMKQRLQEVIENFEKELKVLESL